MELNVSVTALMTLTFILNSYVLRYRNLFAKEEMI